MDEHPYLKDCDSQGNGIKENDKSAAKKGLQQGVHGSKLFQRHFFWQ
jgi:hypothetical protein